MNKKTVKVTSTQFCFFENKSKQVGNMILNKGENPKGTKLIIRKEIKHLQNIRSVKEYLA